MNQMSYLVHFEQSFCWVKIKKCPWLEDTVLSFLEAILLSFIKQVCFCTAEIHNLWTTISLQKKKKKFNEYKIKNQSY